MKNALALLFILMAYSSKLMAGGVIGSGAGIVEMNFQYAYTVLPMWIKNCQRTPQIDNLLKTMCETTGKKGLLYSRIIEIIQNNSEREDRLVFVSAAKDPDFFNTGIHEHHRVAKTYLRPDSSIYINVDQLYNKEDGSPAVGLSTIAAIVLHEVGHQAGEKSHELLNEIASQLRLFLGSTTIIYNFEVGQLSEKVQMTFINQNEPKTSTIIFNWLGNYSMNLTSQVSKLIQCQNEQDIREGYSLYNGQFSPHVQTDKAIDFNFWADIYCISSVGHTQKKEKINLQMTLTDDKKIDLSIKR